MNEEPIVEENKLVRLAPSGGLVQQTVAELEQAFALAVRQRELLSDYIKRQLKPGKHFYEVKGGDNKKPSLAKEGAEIILLPHNYTPDYEQSGGPNEPPEGDQPYQITVKCTLRRKGEPNSFVGSGIGSAGSHKGKWQNNEFVYVPRQRDRYLCHNATLKMAQKSAMVAATINATAASEFFSQDIELEVVPPTQPARAAGKAQKPPVAPPPEATEEQRLRWVALLKPLGQPALEYAYEQRWLLPPGNDFAGEPIEALSVNHVPATKKAADAILAAIRARMGESTQNAPESSQSDLDGVQTSPGAENGSQDALGAPEAVLDGTESIVGTLEAVSEKAGRSSKGPWVRYGLRIGPEVWVNTFSKTLGELAKKDKGSKVRVHYRSGEKGNDLVSIERA